MLLGRLRAFAEDQSKWVAYVNTYIFYNENVLTLESNRLFTPDKKQTRGSISGARASTQAGKRIIEKFGAKQQTTEFRSRRGAKMIRIQRPRTEQEIAQNNKLVRTTTPYTSVQS